MIQEEEDSEDEEGVEEEEELGFISEFFWPPEIIPDGQEQGRKVDIELKDKMLQMKLLIHDPLYHFEGDTDVEDIYNSEEDQDLDVDPEPVQVKKQPIRRGPTSRAHREAAYVPHAH